MRLKAHESVELVVGLVHTHRVYMDVSNQKKRQDEDVDASGRKTCPW